jgi:hypothetical protein
MAATNGASSKERIKRLTAHLKEENPQLVGMVASFEQLDKIGRRLGLLAREESYTAQVAWWPLVSVLGTFSSGKSTFLNNLLGRRLQATGNQAVDEKFTVVCYGREPEPRVLPGLALDGDPRFPFYRISSQIEEIIGGDGQRLDSYLQLKTCNSDQVRGKILIDSPGFDADAQRTATLQITNHILDLSDLVLVFFDARHPEPGAMRDTLEYLVAGPLQRPDFNKFLYILNQIDNAAREDNPEEVFAAWQRALAQRGLTAGRFYQIYDPAAATPIADEHLRRRFETKREQDMGAILDRVRQVEVERAYRIAGKLEHTAKRIRDSIVPRLVEARRTWRRRTLWLDGLAFGLIAAIAVAASFSLGYWQGGTFNPPWSAAVAERPALLWVGVAVLLLAAWQLHRMLRRLAARPILTRLRAEETSHEHGLSVVTAFERNVSSWRPFFFSAPRGWGVTARRRVAAVLGAAHAAIQTLNDRYTDPSGRSAAAAAAPEPITPSAPRADGAVHEHEPPAEHERAPIAKAG